MTVDKDLKRLVRDRAARTGQAYAAARRSLLGGLPEDSPVPVANLWFARASQGYRGKGAKPSGFEHHEIARSDGRLSVRSEIVFSNYGVHVYDVVSDHSTKQSRYEYRGGEVVINASFEHGAWTAIVDVEGETEEVGIQLPSVEPSPSVAARFLPLVHAEESFEYVPVPEDAFPAWRPRGGGSWFPVMGVARETLIEARVVARRGSGPVASIKGAPEALAYDHVNPAGLVRATTWLSEGGELVAYEQAGCVLRAVSEDEARALDPRKAGER